MSSYNGLGGPYTTKSDILAFAIRLKPDLVLADITDVMLDSTTEIIKKELIQLGKFLLEIYL